MQAKITYFIFFEILISVVLIPFLIYCISCSPFFLIIFAKCWLILLSDIFQKNRFLDFSYLHDCFIILLILALSIFFCFIIFSNFFESNTELIQFPVKISFLFVNNYNFNIMKIFKTVT